MNEVDDALRAAQDYNSTIRNAIGSVTYFLVKWTLILLVVALTGLGIFRMTCVDFVENYKIAYLFNLRDGKIHQIYRTGYIVSWPIVNKVNSVDGRPMQVCISAIQRVLNCKLVEFNPAGLQEFLAWHGRADYENDGTRESPSTFNQILMAYAYEGSGKSYSFLNVIRELKPEEVEP